MNWHNVSKREPCPICHKTDWCNLSNDGAVCICHRVESPRLAPSGSGWIHRLREDANWAKRSCGVARATRATIPSAGVVAAQVSPNFAYRECDPRSKSEQEPTIHCSPSPSTFTYTLDFEKVHRSYDNDPILIEGLATTLGVDDRALKSLDVRFNRFDECWSFPMRDAEGRIVGLRYRELAGSRKWSARGSKDGLFYSTVHLHLSPSPKEFIIVEGPSDTAAAMSLFHNSTPTPSTYTYLPVGRSSCQTGSQHLSALIRRVRPARITIVADNDAPGIKGVELLAQQLKNPHRSTPTPSTYTSSTPVRMLIVPAPYKDLRAWYLSNTLTHRLFADLASAQRWR